VKKNSTSGKILSKKLGVFHGQAASLGDYPYAVLLTIVGSARARCAGVLFAYNLVVTTGKLD
jgi:hypothetical protein